MKLLKLYIIIRAAKIMSKNSGMTFQQITLHDEHSIFIHTPIVQTTLVPGVGKDSQFVRELWRIADLYAARIVARRQLGLPLVPQPLVFVAFVAKY